MFCSPARPATPSAARPPGPQHHQRQQGRRRLDYRRGASGNVVEGNYIGTDVTGSRALGNGQINASGGVYITNGANNNLIGTNSDGANDAAERNVISGNAWDNVEIRDAGSNNNVIAGNYIGTDATGMVGLGTGAAGVSIYGGSQHNVVGTDGSHGAFNVDARNIISAECRQQCDRRRHGTQFGQLQHRFRQLHRLERQRYGSLANSIGVYIGNYLGGASLNQVQGNVISGNSGIGLEITGGSQNVVAGNYIGTNPAGTAAVGNGSNGVQIDTGSTGNTIGGTTAGARNIISGNAGNGVDITGSGSTGNVVEGDYIGTNALGTASLGNLNSGVELQNASGNTIGGTGPEPGTSSRGTRATSPATSTLPAASPSAPPTIMWWKATLSERTPPGQLP